MHTASNLHQTHNYISQHQSSSSFFPRHLIANRSSMTTGGASINMATLNVTQPAHHAEDSSADDHAMTPASSSSSSSIIPSSPSTLPPITTTTSRAIRILSSTHAGDDDDDDDSSALLPSTSSSRSPHKPGESSSHIHSRDRKFNWKVFDQGMRFGCLLILLAWVMWDTIVDARLRPNDQDLWVQLILPVYRGIGCMLLLGWCLGASLYVWEKYHINYHYLMEVDPRTFLTAHEILSASCDATMMYLANFLAYYKIMRGDFPPFIQAGWFPMLLCGYIAYKLLPWQTWMSCCRSGTAPPPVSRAAPIWSALGQVVIAPFGKVTFLTGFLGDIWTSMVKVCVDLAYTGCLFMSAEWMRDIETLVPIPPATTATAIFSSSPRLDTCFQSTFFRRAIIPLLSALPLWLRFMQCLKRYINTRKRWPHIGNACKYALAHSVILFGVYNTSQLQVNGSSPSSSSDSSTSPFKVAWILCMVLSTLYTFIWDVTMDWGLGSWKHAGLRDELMFPSRWIYYAAIVIDLFARFTWTLTLIPLGSKDANDADDSPFSQSDFIIYLQPSLAAGEILRRTMWSALRFEWEHINTQSYHRVSDVPPSLAASVPPPLQSEMSGYKVIAEVSVLVVIVLCIGTTAALTAN